MSGNNRYFVSNIILSLNCCLAVLVIMAATLFVFKFYDAPEPSVKEVRSHAVALTVHDRPDDISGVVLQEKRESFSYVVSIISITAILFLSLFLSKKYLAPWLARKDRYLFYSHLTVICTFLAATFLMFALGGSYSVFATSQKIELYLAPFTIFLGIIIALGVLNYGIFARKLLEKRVSLVFVIVAALLSMLVASYGIFDEYCRALEDSSINLSPVTYPIIQEYFGKTLLIDFKNHYGLYAYFTQLFLYIFPANILTLTSVLALLLVVSLGSLAFFLFSIIENKLLALIGFVALVYVQFFICDIWPLEGHVVFQYEPIRLLFPALLLSFLVVFLKNPTALKYYAGLIFAALATLWNLDSGVPIFLTLLIFLGHEKFKNTFQFKGFVAHLAKSLGILTAVWAALFFILRIKYGQWPVISWVIAGHAAAFDFGYAALPIPLLGLWMLPVLIYVIGLALSVNNFLTKNYSQQNSFIFALTLLGIGLFSYFIGRSHETNLFHCCYPAMILLVIFADKFCKNFTKKDLIWFLPKPKVDIFLFSVPLLLLSYLGSAFLFNLFSYPLLSEKFITKKFSQEEVPVWVEEVNFIKRHIGSSPSFVRDDVLMLVLNHKDYFFDLELRIKSPLQNINMHHMFYQEELNSIYNLIQLREKRWVVLVQNQNQKIIALQSMSKAEIKNLQNLLDKNYRIFAQMHEGKESVIIYEKINLSK